MQTYAYRMPIAPPIGIEGQQLAQRPAADELAESEVETANVSEAAGADAQQPTGE